MKRAVDQGIAAIADRQHGVFSRAQVLELGGSDSLIARRRAAGLWVDRADGVYGLPTLRPAWHSKLWSACLASSVGAVISHEAAAALHTLATFRPGPVVITVPHARGRLRDGVVLHQSRRLLADHVEKIGGLPVTTVPRTLVDLAMTCRRSRLAHVLDDTVASGTTTYEDVLATLDAVKRHGRTGSRTLRSVLAQRIGKPTSPSKLERQLLRVLRSANLPEPALQYPLPGRDRPEGVVDVAYPDARLIIEADSRRWHGRQRDFAVDRERDNLAMLAGWRVLRFTWDDVTRRPEWVVECVSRALALRSA